MNDPGENSREFTTTPWDRHGVAALEATGSNARSALASALRAVLSLAGAPVLPSASTGRSAPIRGEGSDLANLFVDMAEELLGEIEHFGSGVDDVVVAGLLRREEGGYVGWGYATGTLEAAAAGEVPRLLTTPTVVEEESRVIIRAQLHRP